MKGVWNDETSAVSYSPSLADRKREKSITIEYVSLPAYTDAQSLARPKYQHRIKTKNIHLLALSAILSLRWIHCAVMAIMGILCCAQWVATFCVPDINIIAESIFLSGMSSGINTTIILLLYRYNILLQQQYSRIETLRKRRNIVNAAQRTFVLCIISCIAIYGILVPGLAQIVAQTL